MNLAESVIGIKFSFFIICFLFFSCKEKNDSDLLIEILTKEIKVNSFELRENQLPNIIEIKITNNSNKTYYINGINDNYNENAINLQCWNFKIFNSETNTSIKYFKRPIYNVINFDNDGTIKMDN